MHPFCRNFPLRLAVAIAFLFCFSLLGTTTNMMSNTTEFSVRVWQTDDGLPQNAVQSMAQTRDGYMWIGTQKGLARFDGIRFTTFDSDNIGDLTHASITALCETLDGRLWIGTEGSGLFQFRDGIFTAFQDKQISTVRSLFERRDGVLLVGTTNGLFQLRTDKLTPIFNGSAVRSMSEDFSSNLWFATTKDLEVISNVAPFKTYTFPNSSSRAVWSARNGDLWIGSSSGLTRANADGVVHFAKQDGLAADMVNVLYEDRAGAIWIGTSGGLNRFAHGELIEVKKSGESFDLVYSIGEDREGNLWVGARDGLHRLSENYFRVYTKKDGLSHNNVTSVCEDRMGGLWIGTWGGGLNFFKNQKFTVYSSGSGLTSDLILGLYEDRKGTLWVGSDFDGGLFRFTDGTFIRIRSGSGLTGSAIRVILEDSKDRRIWLGTSKALSVAKRGASFIDYTSTNGLPGLPVRVLHEDRTGTVWIGTQNGLGCWQAGEIYKVDGLSNESIYTLHDDAEGNLWIGTAGGLNRFKDKKVLVYTKKDGLVSDDIYEILEDDFGWLWISCRNGIFRVSKKNIAEFDRGEVANLHCFIYGKADGLLSTECNGSARPSGCKSRDGSLWFATTKGVVRVNPNIPINQIVPPVFIDEMIADKKQVTSAAWRGRKNTQTPVTRHTSHLALSPGRGELEFHYTALSFRAPEKNCFKYKLDGIDHDWVEAGTRRTAYYNNVPPGAYTFRVVGCNSDGVWNEQGAAIGFVLSPHFWQTWWFKPSLLAGAVLAAIGTFRSRAARQREIEKIRIRIAADLHDEIGSSIGSISLLTRKIQKEGVLAAEQKEDLSSINRLATQSANSIRDIVWFINPDYDTMQDLLLRMKDAANTMLGDVKIRFTSPEENLSRKLPLEFRRNIFLMFKEILGNIAKHSQASEVEISILDREGLWQLEVKDNGTGFDTTAVSRGNGLKNLRHRAEKLNGHVEIKSQVSHGTAVIFSCKKT